MDKIKLTFKGIDGWNRPVFQGEDKKFYGCTHQLFEYGTDVKKVMEKITIHIRTIFE